MRAALAESRRDLFLPTVSLLSGATLIGLVPIFVRFSDSGPTATAFWRMALASALIALVMRSRPVDEPAGGSRRAFSMALVAGVMFAGDLALFHWSIVLTSVANASLLNNLAPVFAGIVAALLGARLSSRYWIGVALSLTGVAVLVGRPAALGGGLPWGELAGIASALFFAFYLLMLEQARRGLSTWRVMLVSGASSTFALLPLALLTDKRVMPASLEGWMAVLALALVCHLGGQALLVYALARLSGAVAALGMLLQPAAAAFFASLIFGETLSLPQLAGAVVILAGIATVLLQKKGI